MNFFSLIFFLALSLICHHLSASVYQHFERIKHKPEVLYKFLQTMPKGGELHYHLAGGAYPQVMLHLAQKNPNFCVNLEQDSIEKKEKGCKLPATALSRTDLYQRLLKAWSMVGFASRDPLSKHTHFFAAFEKFMPVISAYRAQLLKDIVERAAKQNEQYMEIMVLTDNGISTQFAPKKLNWKKLNLHRQKLLAMPGFQKVIERTVSQADHIVFGARHLLHCKQNPKKKACNLMVRFQYYVLREQPIEKVFAQALNGFEAANRKGLIVGVNLVQPENGPISMRDYQKQMAIFQYLHQVYPDTHISLHAGELTEKLVPLSGLTSHIHDAIQIGQAERIGHGVDILSESNTLGIMQKMRNRNIAVEINLTSNEAILGVSGIKHPIKQYLKQGVPVVLSTDDEGVLQTNLTKQYLLAATKYNLSYKTLKQINRNALTYSFLPGKSIWQNAPQAKLVAVCSKLNDLSCQLFASLNPKAAQQRLLELSLLEFERKYN